MTTNEKLSLAIARGVHLLAEDEGKALLNQFGIAVPNGRRVQGLVEAELAAEVELAAQELGYPLVVKALVPGLAHKTDRGAVKLGIRDTADLRGRRPASCGSSFPGAPLLVEADGGARAWS